MLVVKMFGISCPVCTPALTPLLQRSIALHTALQVMFGVKVFGISLLVAMGLLDDWVKQARVVRVGRGSFGVRRFGGGLGCLPSSAAG